MRAISLTFELTEGDQGTLLFLGVQARAVSELLYPGDELNIQRAAELIGRLAAQLMQPTESRLLAERAQVVRRLHAELGRAALVLASRAERERLFGAVYPIVAGDPYAHKCLTELCLDPQQDGLNGAPDERER